MKLASLLAMAILSTGIHIASAQDLVLAVNEGVTYRNAGLASERYKPLLQLLSKELKQNVVVQSVDKYSNFAKGLAAGKYDLAFVHPTHIGLYGVNHNGYEGIATAKGFTQYRAHIMVKKDSPLKTIMDLQGKTIGVPAMESITTTMFRAALRELHFVHPENGFIATRYQAAVPFMIDNDFAVAGVTGSAKVAKKWEDKGGRILAETKPTPIKLFLISKKINAADREKVKNLMLTLQDSDVGNKALAKIGMTGFVPWNDAVMTEASNRLGVN